MDPVSRRGIELAYQDLFYDVIGDYVPAHARPVVGHSPRIMTNVADELCISLVDTGSQVTCMSTEKFKKVDKHKIEILPITNLTVVDAFGYRAKKVDTQIQEDMHIGENKWRVRFMAIPALSYDVIIGNDIMDKLNTIIDYGQKSIRFGESLIRGLSVSINNDLPNIDNELNKVIVRSGIIFNDREIDNQNANKILSIESILLNKMKSNKSKVEHVEINHVDQNEIVKYIRETVNINETDLKKLIDLVLEYQEVFSEEPGCLLGYEHHLKLCVKRPIIRMSYSLPIALRERSQVA